MEAMPKVGKYTVDVAAFEVGRKNPSILGSDLFLMDVGFEEGCIRNTYILHIRVYILYHI